MGLFVSVLSVCLVVRIVDAVQCWDSTSFIPSGHLDNSLQENGSKRAAISGAVWQCPVSDHFHVFKVFGKIDHASSRRALRLV